MATAASLSPLFQAHDVPVPTEGDTAARLTVGTQAEILRTLDRAEEATEAMGTIKAWKTAIAVVKQVMDTVDPIAEVWLTSSLFLRFPC
jgi:tagatose-1,6-bisphosphate aldolase non-catalytic subunit AgaZ/GatZ